MVEDNRESLIRKLLKELPELLADYEHLAPDSDGKIDPRRKKRIQRVGSLLLRFACSQTEQVPYNSSIYC